MLKVMKDYVAQLGDGPFFAGETPGYAAHAHGVAPVAWESISTFPGYGEVPATVTAYPPHPGSLLSLFPRDAPIDAVAASNDA